MAHEFEFKVCFDGFSHILISRSIDVLKLIIGLSGAIRINPPSRSQLTVFLSGKLFFLTYRVVLPCLLLSVWKMVSNIKCSFSFLCFSGMPVNY